MKHEDNLEVYNFVCQTLTEPLWGISPILSMILETCKIRWITNNAFKTMAPTH